MGTLKSKERLESTFCWLTRQQKNRSSCPTSCKKCTNSKIRIPVENNTPGSTIYYTIDGSEPTNASSTGNTVVFASGFVGGRGKEEDDRFVVIKLKAVLNGNSSVTNTYTIRLQKDVKHWIEI